MSKDSIFSRLWKTRNICEDFRTESFKYILDTLLLNHELIGFLKNLNIYINKFLIPEIKTQDVTNSGRFDISIKDTKLEIVFENKWSAGTDIKQLKRYDKYLTDLKIKYKYLVHITKDYSSIQYPFENSFIKKTWGQIYEYLKDYKNLPIINEFLNFLEEERITMEKVSWEIVNGSKSIYALTRLIGRACDELGIKYEWKSSSSDYTSQIIDGKIYVYFLFESGKLYFCVYGGSKPIEEFNISVWKKNFGTFFDFDNYCFFHKTLEEQVDIIKNYISNLLIKLKTVANN